MQVRSIEAVVKALNDAQVKYLVVGGLAVNAHGYLRHTNDMDVVIALDRENVIRALRALERLGFKPRVPITPEEFGVAENRERWKREKGMYVLQLWSDAHRETPVDVFLSEPFPFAEEYARAPQFEVGPGLWCPFVSKDTLLTMKQSVGRAVDLEDVRRLKRL